MNSRPPAAVFSKSLALRSEGLEPCGLVWKLVRKSPWPIHWLIIIFRMKVAILGYTAYISIPYFQTNPCACLWNVKPIDILWTNWRSLRHTPGNVAVQAGHLSRVASQTDDGFSGKPWLEHLLENTLRHEGDTVSGGVEAQVSPIGWLPFSKSLMWVLKKFGRRWPQEVAVSTKILAAVGMFSWRNSGT